MSNSSLHPTLSQEDMVKYSLLRAKFCIQTDSRIHNHINYRNILCWDTVSMTSNVEPVYLSDFSVDEISYKFKCRLELTPYWDESGEYLCVKKDEHSLFVYAKSRKELVENIEEQYAFMWDEFVLADPNELSPKAQLLAAKLKMDIETV